MNSENQPNRQVTITVEQLAQIVREARAPYVDPEKERHGREQREAGLREEIAARKTRKRKQDRCNHLCDNGRAGKSAIGWHLHVGGVWMGTCPRCGRVVKQEDADFDALRRLPNDNIPAISGIL